MRDEKKLIEGTRRLNETSRRELERAEMVAR